MNSFCSCLVDFPNFAKILLIHFDWTETNQTYIPKLVCPHKLICEIDILMLYSGGRHNCINTENLLAWNWPHRHGRQL